MAPDRDDTSAARAVEVIAQFISVNDLDELRAAFLKGEISQEQLINEIAARYQRGIGSAVQALAEHDKALAVQVGERLRDRIEEQLEIFAKRDAASAKKTRKPATTESLKDRDDAVLIRELVILKALAKANAPVRSQDIFALVHKLEPGVSDNLITAHLARMVNMGILGKHGKGKYQQVPAGTAHIAALAKAIEESGLALPPD